jgi:hypothetical protein
LELGLNGIFLGLNGIDFLGIFGMDWYPSFLEQLRYEWIYGFYRFHGLVRIFFAKKIRTNP